MKNKRSLLCLLALALVLGSTPALAAGGAEQMLVSLSYLKDTFFPALEDGIRERADEGTRDVLDAAKQRVDELGEAHLQELSRARPVWTVSDTFQAAPVQGGDVLTLAEGAGLLWQAGFAAAAGEGLVDVTTGSDVPAGGALEVRHRYICAVEGGSVDVKVRSDAAKAAAEGRWALTSNGQDVSRFYDLCSDEWYYSAARWAVSEGIIRGIASSTFGLTGKVDRATIATMLYRMEKATPVPYQGKFNDVPDKQWYTKAVEWAAANKIVVGVGNKSFSPFMESTREHIVVMLYRYARHLGKDVTPAGSLDTFPDGDSVSSWAKNAMIWAVDTGIYQGTDSGSLSPQESPSRAEIACILQQFHIWCGRS